jgi:para-aminobenzoate synthetase/4-amino-4-deoxychorismate lyase
VLLDDARAVGAGPARLYRDPVGEIVARHPDEIRPSLDRLRGAGADGLHAAGFLGYEAGHALEPRLRPLTCRAGEGEAPLLWFGLFEGVEQIAPDQVPALLPDPASAWNTAPEPLIEREAYLAGVERVREHIFAGDIYQANLTFAAELRFAGSPLGLYARLRDRARAGHGGIVFTGTHWLLSFSPELFFTHEAGRLTSRPMKGTAVRRVDPVADAAEARMLREDPKQRAENLMIVDLLRNDLARVSRPGSVEVPRLFEVETYPTVHQMTSTVTATLEEGLGPIDAIEALFPCGSITGAPKIRATEIIAELEHRPRGVYTGSIGSIAPGGDAWFNVAIRTLTARAGAHSARLGLGSGIVVDSRPADEWNECLAKGAFLEEQPPFDLIETMRFDPREGVCDLDRHLARMKASADALGFRFDRHDARNELQAATFRIREGKLLRLLLSPSGAVSVEARPLAPHPVEPVRVAVAPLPVTSDDFRLRHKTTDRGFYAEARRASGAFEVLFRDADGCFTEGSFTHIFVEGDDGRLLTPPLSRGLLPGILRERLIERGEAVEADLEALPGRFYIGNAVRGLIRATILASDGADSAVSASSGRRLRRTVQAETER